MGSRQEETEARWRDGSFKLSQAGVRIGSSGERALTGPLREMKAWKQRERHGEQQRNQAPHVKYVQQLKTRPYLTKLASGLNQIRYSNTFFFIIFFFKLNLKKQTRSLLITCIYMSVQPNKKNYIFSHLFPVVCPSSLLSRWMRCLDVCLFLHQLQLKHYKG